MVKAADVAVGARIPGHIRPNGPFLTFVPDAAGPAVLCVTQNVRAMVWGERDRSIEGRVEGTGPYSVLGLVTTDTPNDLDIPTL